MSRIAFYAPMKSPNHPVPSGDREMARGVMKALADESRGYEVTLVSEFRCYDGKGDGEAQNALFQHAKSEVSRLVKMAGWSAWVTYHSYYKAPDLLGPAVSQALGIPYVQIEATRAAKRLGGPWDAFARAADASCDAAAAIFFLTAQDQEGLAPYKRDDQPQVQLHPFLAREEIEQPAAKSEKSFLSVGMMRQGDKLSSYQIIAEALVHLDEDWVYEIAGDGPARPEVEAVFAPFGDKVRFLGQLGTEDMAQAYGRARAFLWPGVNEAFGMVYLEAQAAGVPVVAQDRAGVRDVLPGAALVQVGDPARLAQNLSRLLNDASYRSERSYEARSLVRNKHLLGSARKTLWSVLNPLLKDT